MDVLIVRGSAEHPSVRRLCCTLILPLRLGHRMVLLRRDQHLARWIRTSPIRRILGVPGETLQVETANSTYQVRFVGGSAR